MAAKKPTLDGQLAHWKGKYTGVMKRLCIAEDKLEDLTIKTSEQVSTISRLESQLQDAALKAQELGTANIRCANECKSFQDELYKCGELTTDLANQLHDAQHDTKVARKEKSIQFEQQAKRYEQIILSLVAQIVEK